MPSPFSITSATNGLRLSDKRQGQTTFTVFNAAGRPMRGRARLVPDDEATQSWLTLEGEAERSFAIAAAEQYVVQVAVPKEAEAGSYRFRLDMVDVENPDEGHVQGPAVTFEAAEMVIVEPWWKEKMWMILVAVGVLVLGGIAAFFLLGGDGAEVPDVAGLTADAAEAQLADAGFSFGVRQSVFDDSLAAGVVVGTDPEAGEEVEEGRSVSLIVSQGPDLVAVPDVSGVEVIAAIAKLDSSGLQLSQSMQLQNNNAIPEGRVIGTNPAVNVSVRRGTEVALIASKGPSGSVPPRPGRFFGTLEVNPDITSSAILLNQEDLRVLSQEAQRVQRPQQ